MEKSKYTAYPARLFNGAGLADQSALYCEVSFGPGIALPFKEKEQSNPRLET
jgi:hypothetical protein